MPAWLVVAILLTGAFSSSIALPERGSLALASSQSRESSQHVTARLISDFKEIKGGRPFRLGVELKMQPGWHTYYREAGEAGMPTSIEWKLPEGFKAGELLWEKPERFNDAGIVTYGYHDQTVIAAEIRPPEQLQEDKYDFAAKVSWLECKEICIPGKAEVALSLKASSSSGAPASGDASKFSQVGFKGDVSDLSGGPNVSSDGAQANIVKVSIMNEKLTVNGAQEANLSLAAYFGLALLGGFILNFMPCVLPVIAIKVISLVEQSSENPTRVRLLGLTFAGGILASFITLGGIVLAVQAAGQTVGWGFQFQYPPFVIAMATVCLVLALSLFGLFYVTVPAGQNTIDRLASKEGFAGTFFKGVLATVLSTPCTAPALGTAVGFAFSQPPYIVLGIFFTVGLGMSLPYILLTINPDWMRFIPRPGVWMEKFKESMAFVLLATVIWLLGILGSQVGETGIIWTGYFLTAVAFSVWLVGRFTDLTSSPARKATVYPIAVFISGLAFYFCVYSRPELSSWQTDPQAVSAFESNPHTGQDLSWEPFTVENLDLRISQNKTIFLDFTAAWCLTCQANEQTVLKSNEVVKTLKALNVVTMKADWTRQDPQITQLLKKFNRSGVPLYVIFPSGRATEPIVLPEVITPSIVVEKLNQAGASKG